MPIQVKKDKIILYKHTCNYELIKTVALDVKNSCNSNISVEERYKMQERLAAINLYKTRNPESKPLDSINHRINTLEYWMFGYEEVINRQPFYLRVDSEDEECIPDKYETEQEAIDDATRFYHDHFNMDEDYDDGFEIKDFKQALSFWEANGYMILKAEILNYKEEEK